ncbi:MAG: asparagine synthetase B [Desulfobacteraceae bacterium]|nr:MAG: asparagine synthetase B [Desulfobacteraceae bacterium]
MSRIAGIYATDCNHRVLLDQMLAGLGPRSGPESRHSLLGHAALGYAGKFPAMAGLGSFLAVFDGTISNADELPQSSNDAGRFLLLFERHGFEGALMRLCGDFAVALYDAREDTLWLGRDRAGIRPCYYASFEAGIAFASQPQALLRLPGVSRQINHKFAALFAGSHYRTFDHDPTRSPYEAVHQLPAAHLARIHNGRFEVRRWWELVEAPDFTQTGEELAERYRELFFKVVAERLRYARRPAFTLSGGMDSSSVLATAVRLSGAKQQAFSSVYEDPTFDETAEIATILDAAVERWHPVPIGQVDLFAIVRDMVAAHGEPVATATWLSHWLLCRQVADAGFETLFGGLGGDELNAGEYEYFFFHFADLRAAGRQAELDHEIAAWAHHHDHPVWRKNRQVAEEALSRLVDADRPGQCLADRRRIERYAHVLRPDCFDPLQFVPVLDGPFSSYLKNRTWQDIFRETAPCCLRAEDRHADAFSLINVNPFYDHRLMEFMFRIPGTLKIRDGVTKILLRRAMQGVLPEATRLRVKKTGWNAPAHIWFTGRQADDVRDLVNSSDFKATEYYDRKEVLRLLDEHCAIVESKRSIENHMMFFWQLLSLEIWLDSVQDF